MCGQRFEVIKYFKGPHERGLVLRSNEELIQTLEDQMMNLSSMMSSRFVAPFLEITQKWERLMSNISEVIEVWMKVRRLLFASPGRWHLLPLTTHSLP